MRLIITALLALSLAACSGIETETLREKPLLLKGMKTYQWAMFPGETAGGDASHNRLMHEFLRHEIDGIMAAKGYEKRVSGADMELDYRVLILQDKRELYQADEIAATEYGVEWRFDRDHLPQRGWKHEEPAHFELYQKGKLVFGAIDTRSGKAVWMRSAEKPLDPESDQADREAILRTIAKKLMKPFPARP